jgi:fructose-1,6-bisphosphatase/inositol monophosphatase family enzyme
MIWAEKGFGATWNGRSCRVSQRKTIEGATICCGGHASMNKSGRMPALLRLAEATQATRTWCDAYGHALVATGRVDAMIDPVVAEWDTAALRPIIAEAGGLITSFAGGEPLTEALSTNGWLHDTLREAFSG